MRGNGWVKGGWVMRSKLSAKLRFCFFSLFLLSESLHPVRPRSQQNSGRTVGWLQGWRDEVTEEKGMTGSYMADGRQCETEEMQNPMNRRSTVH